MHYIWALHGSHVTCREFSRYFYYKIGWKWFSICCPCEIGGASRASKSSSELTLLQIDRIICSQQVVRQSLVDLAQQSPFHAKFGGHRIDSSCQAPGQAVSEFQQSCGGQNPTRIVAGFVALLAQVSPATPCFVSLSSRCAHFLLTKLIHYAELALLPSLELLSEKF